MSKYKLGHRTNRIWAGDIVSECEFVTDISEGRMIFYDIKFKCFRIVFYELNNENDFILNGWKCANTISELI